MKRKRKDRAQQLQTYGVLRAPLHTKWTCDGRYRIHEHIGLSRFLRHNFVGNAREQLVLCCRHLNLVTSDEMAEALRDADLEKQFDAVTGDSVKYVTE